MAAVVQPSADSDKYVIGTGRACLEPNRANDRPVDVARALPGVVVLVHGVNDLGVCYPAQEAGLCAGLNERLSRADLVAAGYRLPSMQCNEKLEADPDAVYYRRDGQGYGPVIPFYWGYREEEERVNKHAPHGQYLDRHGNRLDKSGAQGGGPFANATSNLPDMWDGGFRAYAGLLNLINGDPTHPLRPGPDRRYMVLAALRLASLVQAVRARAPNDTVTLIGHSQGCLLSLLAQAFLQSWHERPADCLILNHPPYSLDEPYLEKSQTWDLQQSAGARLKTLQNLVSYVTEQPHGQPALAELEEGRCRGICGPFWTAARGQRPDPANPGQLVAFAERDNRGKVYLYFCPEDLTVGLDNVIGIGSFGVPEQVEIEDDQGYPQQAPALPSLGQRFFQRLFTMRERGHGTLPVGAAPGDYCLREKGEDFHRYAPRPADASFRHVPKVQETRRITGEALNPPCVPNLRCGEIKQGFQAVDPIDASVAITNGGIRTRDDVIDDPRPTGTKGYSPPHEGLRPDEVWAIEQAANQDKQVEDRYRVRSASQAAGGKIHITRTETPNEARLRQQSQEMMANSYHSAIVANPEHSRHIHAFDVAIGQGESVNDPTFRDLLLKMADWRVLTKLKRGINAPLLKKLQENPSYANLPARTKTFVEANATYYTDGTLPLDLIPEPPGRVVSRTLREVQQKREQQARAQGGA